MRLSGSLLLCLLLGTLGCVSSKYVEQPQTPTPEPVYEDEANVVQYKTTEELGEAHPHLVVDGQNLDYDKDLKWFVYAGTKTKAYWLEPAVYEPNTVPDRVLVKTGPDGHPVIDPTAGLTVTRVWNDSTKMWDKPDGKGGFRPWDPEQDGDAPPPPPVIDDKVTQVDEEENVWHVLKPVLVATRPESVPNVFANPTPDERRIQTERRKQGKLVWLYPTTQLKLLDSGEFAGMKYREFALVAAVLDADANGEPIDLYRVYITNEVLMQPELFKLGPQQDLVVEQPAADTKPDLRNSAPPGPTTFTEVELAPGGGVIEIGTPSDAATNPKTEIDGVKVRYDAKRKEYFDVLFGTRLILFAGGLPDFQDYRGHAGPPFESTDGDIRFVYRKASMEIMEGGEWRAVKTGDTIAAMQAPFMAEKPDERDCQIGTSRFYLTTTGAPAGRYRIIVKE
jgi:hypothetical protein